MIPSLALLNRVTLWCVCSTIHCCRLLRSPRPSNSKPWQQIHLHDNHKVQPTLPQGAKHHLVPILAELQAEGGTNLLVVTAEVQGEDIPEVPTMTAEDLYEGVPTEMVVDKMVVEEEVDEATTLTTIT